MAPNARTKKIIETNKAIKKAKPKEVIEPLDIEIEFKNDMLYVKHPINNKVPKFIRIKSTILNDEYKLSEYRISEV